MAQYVNVMVIAAYMMSVLGLGLYLSRFVKRDEDFFLAGRTLNKWIVAGTIMATDIAALYIIGPAGCAYKSGVPVLLCSWTGGMIASVSALIFVPRLRRLRMTTITEVMEERYNVWLRLLPTILWIIYYSLLTGNFTYVLSVILQPVLAPVLGITNPNQITLIVGAVVVTYCFASGLLAVTYTDVFQTFLIILGALVLLPVSMKAVGGVHSFVQNTPQDYFVFWKKDPTVYPNYKDLMMFILVGLPYWCTSQYMLQRSFAGRSVRDASRGLMLAALMTGPIIFAYNIPGIAGHILYPEGTLATPDTILPRMFTDILPLGLSGIFLAALLAAANSSAAGVLSSMSTLSNNDLYARFRPGKSSRHYLWFGRFATILGGMLGLVFAYNMDKFKGVLDANMNIMATFEPVVFVPIAGALLYRRANAWGAVAAIVAGVVFGALSWICGGLAGPDIYSGPQWLAVCVTFFDQLTAADLIFYTLPMCIGVLIVFSWIGERIHPRTPEKAAQVDAFFGRMKGQKINWSYGWGWVGIFGAVAALATILSIWLCPEFWPKPQNVLIHMGILALFVFSCYLTVPMFVVDDAEEVRAEAAQLQAKSDAGKTIEGTRLQKFIGSGWSWFAIYGSAIALVFILYFGPWTFPFKIVLKEEKAADALVLSISTNKIENAKTIAEELVSSRQNNPAVRVLFYAVGKNPVSDAPVAKYLWTKEKGVVEADNSANAPGGASETQPAAR